MNSTIFKINNISLIYCLFHEYLDIADVKEKETQNLMKHKEIQEREIKRLTANTDS